MRDTLRVLLRPANLARGLAVVVALLIGVAIFGSLDLGSGGDAPLDINAAAPPALNAEEEREALRTLGNELCDPTTDRQRDRRLALRTQLANSLSDDDLTEFWTRAVSGKTVVQMETAFFGCASLTDWMRHRALAEGVSVSAIIEAEVSEPLGGASGDVGTIEGVLADVTASKTPGR